LDPKFFTSFSFFNKNTTNMTNRTKFLTALSVGGVLISSAAGFMVVNAQTANTAGTSNSTSVTTNQGQNNPMRRMMGDNTKMDAVRTALDNKDYSAWKTAITSAPNSVDQLAKIDTQAKFDQLVQAHEYLKTNEPDKAKAIFDTLGIQMPGRGMGGHGGKMGDETQDANRKAEQDALDSGNYEAWKTAVAATPNGAQIIAKVDTQAKFTQLSDAHKAVKTAHETEQKVRTDLGLDGLMGPGGGKGMGMMRGNTQNPTNATTTTQTPANQ
jgi:hypothetical protein